MSDNASWGMLLPFDTDDFEFVRGFELGRVWALTGAEDLELPMEPLTLHAENAEMVLRIAEARGLSAQSTELGDGWIDVTFDCAPGGVSEVGQP